MQKQISNTIFLRFAVTTHLRNGVYRMLINHSRLTEKWAMKPYTKSKFVPLGRLMSQRAWDCPLYGFFGYRLFFRFFTMFSRCFTWFFVTFRICYKYFTSTETTRVSFVLGLWVSIRGPQEF